MEQYRLECWIPGLQQAGQILAAIPFLETKSLRGAKKLISLPFSDCVRVLAKDPSDAIALCHQIRKAKGKEYSSITIRTDKPLVETSRSGQWLRHELELKDMKASITDRLPSSLKRNLRKAERSGLRFSARTDWQAVKQFYHLHLLTRKKLGVPVQPKQFFRRLHEKMLKQDLGFVGLVRQGDRVLAAAVFLTFGGMMTYKYGASDPCALALRPNDYLFHQVMQRAVEQDFDRFDFGITFRCDEGLRQFKRKWGARELDVHHFRIAGRVTPSLEDSNALKLVSAVIRRSPPIVCRLVGELCYRYSQ